MRPSDRRGPGPVGHRGRNVRSTGRCSYNLRITRRRADSCGLHRSTSQVIRRSGSGVTTNNGGRASSRARVRVHTRAPRARLEFCFSFYNKLYLVDGTRRARIVRDTRAGAAAGVRRRERRAPGAWARSARPRRGFTTAHTIFRSTLGRGFAARAARGRRPWPDGARAAAANGLGRARARPRSRTHTHVLH